PIPPAPGPPAPDPPRPGPGGGLPSPLRTGILRRLCPPRHGAAHAGRRVPGTVPAGEYTPDATARAGVPAASKQVRTRKRQGGPTPEPPPRPRAGGIPHPAEDGQRAGSTSQESSNAPDHHAPDAGNR